MRMTLTLLLGRYNYATPFRPSRRRVLPENYCTIPILIRLVNMESVTKVQSLLNELIDEHAGREFDPFADFELYKHLEPLVIAARDAYQLSPVAAITYQARYRRATSRDAPGEQKSRLQIGMRGWTWFNQTRTSGDRSGDVDFVTVIAGIPKGFSVRNLRDMILKMSGPRAAIVSYAVEDVDVAGFPFWLQARREHLLSTMGGAHLRRGEIPEYWRHPERVALRRLIKEVQGLRDVVGGTGRASSLITSELENAIEECQRHPNEESAKKVKELIERTTEQHKNIRNRNLFRRFVSFIGRKIL